MKKNKLRSLFIVMAVSLCVFAGCGKDSKDVVEVDFPQEQVVNEDIDIDEDISEENVEEVEAKTDDTTIKEETSDESKEDDSINSEEEKLEKDSEDKAQETDEDKVQEIKPSATGSNIVATHGKLSVKGTQLVDKDGNPFQLQGVSTHGLGWFPGYVDKAGFQTMRDEWGINCVRLAMYTAEYNGYCTGGSQSELKNLVNKGVSYASELGLYVIIDWHILSDNNPNNYKSEAIAYFNEMSSKYKDFDNVLYEICNEPNGGTSWSDIKSYAMEVIPVIKKNDPDAIIIVGTPTWSQDVDKAAADPITGYTNIMYTIHFYADTHRDDLRNKMTAAISKGLPVICTEFGITDASGNGAVNTSEGDKWISLLQKNGVGYCIWNLSNKDESSALIKSSCNKTSGWSEADLSEEGKWYLGILGGKALGNYSSSEDNNSSNDTTTEGKHKADEDKDVATGQSGNLSVNMKQTGSWNDGKADFYQYTFTVKSTGSSANGWKVVADFGKDVKIDQFWSCENDNKGNGTIILTPVDYNINIEAGKSIEFGIIISGSDIEPKVSIY